MVHLGQLSNFLVTVHLRFGVGVGGYAFDRFPDAGTFLHECNTSITNLRDQEREYRLCEKKQASKEITSESVEPRDTEVCFLHI